MTAGACAITRHPANNAIVARTLDQSPAKGLSFQVFWSAMLAAVPPRRRDFARRFERHAGFRAGAAPSLHPPAAAE